MPRHGGATPGRFTVAAGQSFKKKQKNKKRTHSEWSVKLTHKSVIIRSWQTLLHKRTLAFGLTPGEYSDWLHKRGRGEAFRWHHFLAQHSAPLCEHGWRKKYGYTIRKESRENLSNKIILFRRTSRRTHCSSPQLSSAGQARKHFSEHLLNVNVWDMGWQTARMCMQINTAHVGLKVDPRCGMMPLSETPPAVLLVPDVINTC